MKDYPVNFKNRRSADDGAFSCLIIVLVALFIAIISFDLLFSKIYVVGNSMDGTFTGAAGSNTPGGDYVYIMRNVEPKRGDVVVISTDYVSENSDGKILIKRLIAKEYDTIELDRGQLYLNGEAVEEPYVLPKHNTPNLKQNSFGQMVVPEGCVFCMGDNRNDSVDSRSYYGFIPLTSIIGVVSDWSMRYQGAVTAFNTFFEFTLPGKLGIK